MAKEREEKLNPDQEEQAKELASTRAHIIHEVVLREGKEEVERSPSSLAWSGLAAGLSMGLSLMTEGLVRAQLPETPWSPLLVNLGYPVGFMVAILGRQHLYTENTLTPVVPFLENRDRQTFRKMIRLCSIVLLTNLIGSVAFGWICTREMIFSLEARTAFEQISRVSLEGQFWGFVLRGLFGGWLIALLTWLLSGVKSGEIPLIFILTYLVGIGNFSHVVVGASESSFLAFIGEISWQRAILGYVFPAFLGNTVGGIGFVALLNHAQVVSGSRKRFTRTRA